MKWRNLTVAMTVAGVAAGCQTARTSDSAEREELEARIAELEEQLATPPEEGETGEAPAPVATRSAAPERSAARPAPAVVVMHGWGANASVMLPLARPLHGAGFHTILVDARGHGMSEEDDYASMPRFSEDLDVAVDWVLAHDAVTRVGVVGHSIGAAAAILAAARDTEHRITCVVEVSGFADVWDVMMESSRLGQMPAAAAWAVRRTMEYVLGDSLDSIAPVGHIGRIQVPTMIVHGDRDEVVDVQHAFRLAEANPNADLRVIAGGTHGDLPGFEAKLGPILGFLTSHLDGAAHQSD